MSPDKPPVDPERLTLHEHIQQTPDFQALRRSLRRFVFPLTAGFLVWYFTYVVLAAFAPDFFAIEVAENINVGLLFGLGQFVSTALITVAYVRWADAHLDAPAARLRDEVESLQQPASQSAEAVR